MPTVTGRVITLVPAMIMLMYDGKFGGMIQPRLSREKKSNRLMTKGLIGLMPRGRQGEGGELVTRLCTSLPKPKPLH